MTKFKRKKKNLNPLSTQNNAQGTIILICNYKTAESISLLNLNLALSEFWDWSNIHNFEKKNFKTSALKYCTG